LRYVVFSQKPKKSNRWARVKEYGLWWTCQFLLKNISFKLLNQKIPTKSTNINPHFLYWRTLKDEQHIIDKLRADGVKVIFVASFQHILKNKFVNSFDPIINIHRSILPNHKGPEAIVWGLLEKAKYFGFTFHLIDEGVDTGPIIEQVKIQRPRFATAASIDFALSKKVPVVAEKIVDALTNNTLDTRDQGDGFYRPPATLENRRKYLNK